MAAKKTEGIEVRHEKGCRSGGGRSCNCAPSYRAHVWSARDNKLVRRTFRNLTEAKHWRADALTALRKGTLRSPSRIRVDQAATAWLEGARSGLIRNRSGDRYKPSALRSYDEALTLRVLPALGGYRLSELRRVDVQDFVDQLVAKRLAPSTIRNSLLPLRAIYRRAMSRGEVGINPTASLELPAVRGKRDRIADPHEAGRLLAALPAGERALWATAFYAGLRHGELRALRWSDVNLATGTIRVERGWDQKAGEIEPKSRAGRRTVPIPAILRDYLDQHRIESAGEGLVFGRSPRQPFSSSTVNDRAQRAWKAANEADAQVAEEEGRGPDPLQTITLHECRHTFASMMIAAGVNAKALSTYLGHGSIQITFDRYGHLMPGNEEEAANLLDAYLEQAVAAGVLVAQAAA